MSGREGKGGRGQGRNEGATDGRKGLGREGKGMKGPEREEQGQREKEGSKG